MDFPILTDIVVIFALSTGVNLLFTRIKIPTIVGYLLTGILAGPHLFGLVSGKHEIEVLAEIGVALLLFTIGMEFSIKHLVRIRRVVFFGGFLQVFLSAGIFFFASKFFDLSWQAGVFMGFLGALSSSALVLKLLQERSELSSNYGRTVLGILIFQDLMLVPLLLFSNILSGADVDVSTEVLWLSLKAILIIGLVYVGNKWILPSLLKLIAQTKNQELFMMSIFLICFSIALLTWKLGMSIAFGAFLAGLMVSDSEYSHHAFANLLPFKDTFTSFFFVSIGMLLDFSFILDNPLVVISAIMMVLVVKAFIAGGTGFILGHTLRGTILVGMALAQVGEFSFILAKIGYDLNIINSYIYQLFLAVAVITMAFTPFLMKLSRPLAHQILKLPLPKFMVEGLFPLKEVAIPDLKNHLVIIGKDASAIKLSRIITSFNMPHVSIVFDPSLAKEKMDKGENVIYGDAANEPILLNAYTDKADAVVVSVGNPISAMAIIDKVRKVNAKARIIARAHKTVNVKELYKVGADEVLPEKLEIAIDLFNRVLTGKLVPVSEINKMTAKIRTQHLGEYIEKDTVNKPTIFDEIADLKISAIKIESETFANGKTIKALNLRQQTGITILAIKRGSEIMEHPEPDVKLYTGDIIYTLGNHEQIDAANSLFNENTTNLNL